MSRLLIGLVVMAAIALADAGIANDEYTQSVLAWQHKRDKSLRSENGWLALAGLFWIPNGRTETIGAGSQNSFVLQEGSAPIRLGRLTNKDGKILLENLAGTAVTVNNKPAGSRIALSDDPEHPDIVRAGTTSFFVIKRNEKVGLRVKDSQNPQLKKFAGMKYFPIDPRFRFQAKFIDGKKMIPILNVLGQTEMQESPGIVEFSHNGHQYRLRPIIENDTLFFLYKDPTNKTTTYQAGRMLNTPMPKDGLVDLDFNHSYNPPCTFTPYATCPLPPKDNTLPFAVDAGELRYGKGHPE